MFFITDVTVSLVSEFTAFEMSNIDICVMVETEGSLLTQLTVTFTILEEGTASNNTVYNN